ncbi:MAG: hypothetical protein WC022_01975 [Parcubacteria group bacterium]
MFSRRRIISHLVLWSLIAMGAVLAFYAVSPEIIFKKSFNHWWIILPLAIFLVYHLVSAFYWRDQFNPDACSEKRIIRAGVYGKCAHPTCTSLIILSWIIFFYYPDTRILTGAAWLTFMVIFWIRIEKAFFIGKKSKFESKKPEPA